MSTRPPIGSIDRTHSHVTRRLKAERREILFTIRLTDLEAQMLAAAAQRAGVTPTQLARERLFPSGVADQSLGRLERLLSRLERLDQER